MNRTRLYFCLLPLAPVLFVVWFLLSKKEDKALTHLPYYGPAGAGSGQERHTVPAFSFTDQDGNRITKESVANKVYVAEYFFTTCQSICPIMNNNLVRVHRRFSQEKDFLILSHTVDPETDSSAVLKAYALSRGVSDKKWLFLTGPKPHLYEIARKGYLLNAEEGKGDAEDFIHTQNFALVDRKGHLRGFYDGTDSLEVNKMMNDINALLKE